MKKMLLLVCCALGGVMIGFFANRLDTVYGGLLFALGVAVLVFFVAAVTRHDKEDK